MFWFPKSTLSIKPFVPLPAQLITQLSNVPPAVLLIGSLWTALAMLPAHPDISVPESLSMLAKLFVPAVALLIVLHALRSRSEPALAITDDASAREGYRCLFRQNESVSFIVTLIYGPKLTVRVPRSASVDALLAAVDKKWTNTHGPRGGLMLRLLTSTGKELQRSCFLADYNFQSNSLLFEAPDLRGGMQRTDDQPSSSSASSPRKTLIEAGVYLWVSLNVCAGVVCGAESCHAISCLMLFSV